MAYTARDLFRQPLSRGELAELAARAGGARAIFSWKSPSARPLALDPATVDDAQLLDLMRAEPRLVRRPLVLSDGQLIVGGDPRALERLLA